MNGKYKSASQVKSWNAYPKHAQSREQRFHGNHNHNQVKYAAFFLSYPQMNSNWKNKKNNDNSKDTLAEQRNHKMLLLFHDSIVLKPYKFASILNVTIQLTM